MSKGTQGVNAPEVDRQGRGTHAIYPWMFLWVEAVTRPHLAHS